MTRSPAPSRGPVLFLTAWLAACGQDEGGDPEVDAGPCADLVGPRAIVAGELDRDDAAFVPWSAGSVLPVVTGVQAGYWFMPSIRCTGCAEEGRMRGRVRLVSGEMVGEADNELRPSPQLGGAMQVEYFLIPVGQYPKSPPVDFFYDKRANFEYSYDDGCDAGLEGAVEVILEDRTQTPIPTGRTQ